MDAVAPQFREWLFSTMDTPDVELADVALANIETLAQALAAANPSFRLTAWTSSDVDNLLDEILPSGRLGGEHWRVAGQAAMLLNFLVASGLWDGEPAHLAHCNARLARQLATPPSVPKR